MSDLYCVLMCLTVIGLSSHGYYISTHFGFLQLLFHVNNFKGDEKGAPLSILLIPLPRCAVNEQQFYVFPK